MHKNLRSYFKGAQKSIDIIFKSENFEAVLNLHKKSIGIILKSTQKSSKLS